MVREAHFNNVQIFGPTADTELFIVRLCKKRIKVLCWSICEINNS